MLTSAHLLEQIRQLDAELGDDEHYGIRAELSRLLADCGGESGLAFYVRLSLREPQLPSPNQRDWFDTFPFM